MSVDTDRISLGTLSLQKANNDKVNAHFFKRGTRSDPTIDIFDDHDKLLGHATMSLRWQHPDAEFPWNR